MPQKPPRPAPLLPQLPKEATTFLANHDTVCEQHGRSHCFKCCTSFSLSVPPYAPITDCARCLENGWCHCITCICPHLCIELLFYTFLQDFCFRCILMPLYKSCFGGGCCGEECRLPDKDPRINLLGEPIRGTGWTGGKSSKKEEEAAAIEDPDFFSKFLYFISNPDNDKASTIQAFELDTACTKLKNGSKMKCKCVRCINRAIDEERLKWESLGMSLWCLRCQHGRGPELYKSDAVTKDSPDGYSLPLHMNPLNSRIVETLPKKPYNCCGFCYSSMYFCDPFTDLPKQYRKELSHTRAVNTLGVPSYNLIPVIRGNLERPANFSAQVREQICHTEVSLRVRRPGAILGEIWREGNDYSSFRRDVMEERRGVKNGGAGTLRVEVQSQQTDDSSGEGSEGEPLLLEGQEIRSRKPKQLTTKDLSLTQTNVGNGNQPDELVHHFSTLPKRFTTPTNLNGPGLTLGTIMRTKYLNREFLDVRHEKLLVEASNRQICLHWTWKSRYTPTVYKHFKLKELDEEDLKNPDCEKLKGKSGVFRAKNLIDRAHVTVPPNSVTSKEFIERVIENEDHKIILFVHGGGHMFKKSTEYNGVLELLLQDSNRNDESVGVSHLSVDYRRAPDVDLRVQVDDVLQTYLFLVEKMKINPKRICVYGDSAGCGLILHVLMKLRDMERDRAGSGMLSRTNSKASLVSKRSHSKGFAEVDSDTAALETAELEGLWLKNSNDSIHYGGRNVSTYTNPATTVHTAASTVTAQTAQETESSETPSNNAINKLKPGPTGSGPPIPYLLPAGALLISPFITCEQNDDNCRSMRVNNGYDQVRGCSAEWIANFLIMSSALGAQSFRDTVLSPGWFGDWEGILGRVPILIQSGEHEILRDGQCGLGMRLKELERKLWNSRADDSGSPFFRSRVGLQVFKDLSHIVTNGCDGSGSPLAAVTIKSGVRFFENCWKRVGERK